MSKGLLNFDSQSPKTGLGSDYNLRLNGQAAYQTYLEMFNDATVKNSAELILNPIAGNDYQIKSFDDKNEYQKAFFEKELFYKRDFNLILEEILWYLIFGHKFIHYQLKYNSKTKLLEIDEFLPISNQTIKKIYLKNGRFYELELEGYIDGKKKTVQYPFSCLLSFFYNQSSEKPDGESLFRAMLRPWDMKKKLINLEAVGKEREALGVVLGLSKKNGEKSKSDLARVLKRISENRLSYAAFSKDELENLEDIKILYPSTLSSLKDSISFHDKEILKCSKAYQLILADGVSGSYALGKVHLTTFFDYLNRISSYICSVFNSLIREITIANWGEQEKYCKMVFKRFENVHYPDYEQLISLLSESGGISSDELRRLIPGLNPQE